MDDADERIGALRSGRRAEGRLVVAEGHALGADQVLDIQLTLQFGKKLSGPLDARQLAQQARVCPGRQR